MIRNSRTISFIYVYFYFRDTTTLSFVVLTDDSTDSLSNVHSDKEYIDGDDVVIVTTVDVDSGSPNSGLSSISGYTVTRIYNKLTMEALRDNETWWTETHGGRTAIAGMALAGVGLLAGVGAATAKILSRCRKPPGYALYVTFTTLKYLCMNYGEQRVFSI